MAITEQDLSAFGVEEDFLVNNGRLDAYPLIFLKGKNATQIQNKKGEMIEGPHAAGFFLAMSPEHNPPTQDLLEACAKTVKQYEGLPKDEQPIVETTVIHEDQTRKKYYHFQNPIFHILAVGMPNFRDMKDPKNHLGFASGITTNINRKNGTVESYSRETYTSFLVLESHLVAAGYTQPLRIQLTSYSSNEVQGALKKHLRLLQELRRTGKDKTAQFYQYGVHISASGAAIAHGVGTSRAVIVDQPTYFDEKYIASIKANPTMMDLLRDYIFEMGEDGRYVPRGQAYQWAKETMEYMAERDKRYNPDAKHQLPFKAKSTELPVWLRDILNNQSITTDDDLPADDAPFDAKLDELDDQETIKTSIEMIALAVSRAKILADQDLINEGTSYLEYLKQGALLAADVPSHNKLVKEYCGKVNTAYKTAPDDYDHPF